MRNINVEIAEAFEDFINDWNYETYFVFGGYGSGKSYSIAFKIVLKLLQEVRTALVVRAVFGTIKESCFALFKDILEKMDLLSEETSWRRIRRNGEYKVLAVQSPMELRFPNGSRVIFKGMDDQEKIKSIHGVSIVWMEECSEIRYNAYQELLGRIRENNVSLHFILSCNPVGRENWVYNEFFVRKYTIENDYGEQEEKTEVIQDEKQTYRKTVTIGKKNNVYYHHSVPDDNPFLPDSYIKRLDDLRYKNYALWRVARKGMFGANGRKVLPRFEVAKNASIFKSAVNSIPARYHFFGLDFGFEESYNALLCCAVDDANKILYIYDEVYMNNITDDRFSRRLDVRKINKRAIRCKQVISADSAEPKSISYYQQNGFAMRKSKKFAGSRLQYTRKMQRFEKIICSPKCKNAINELQDLTYAKDKQGNYIYDEFNIDSHCMSALWYALDTYEIRDIKYAYKNNSYAA